MTIEVLAVRADGTQAVEVREVSEDWFKQINTPPEEPKVK